MKLTRKARRIRVAIKRALYSQLYLRDTLLLMFGRTKPLVRFTVEAEPPSVYFNFEILPERLEQLERELDLPYPLCPIRCIEGEEPFFALTLNIYRVSGLAVGIRAEWSVYVRDDLGIPRYMVVEAAGSGGSVEPVGLISLPVALRYEREGEWLVTEYAPHETPWFKSRTRAPETGEPVRPSSEWIQANDYIYWRNGLCDRCFYDSGMANARARKLDVSEVEIEDRTPWSRFVDPVPHNVIIYEDAIDIAMSPWWNLDDMKDAPER